MKYYQKTKTHNCLTSPRRCKKFFQCAVFEQYTFILHVTFKEQILRLGAHSPINYCYSNPIFCCKELVEEVFHQLFMISIVLTQTRVMWLLWEKQILTYCRVGLQLHRSHSHKPGSRWYRWWNIHSHIHHNVDPCIQVCTHTDPWQSHRCSGPLNPQHYSCTEVLCAREERREIGKKKS